MLCPLNGGKRVAAPPVEHDYHALSKHINWIEKIQARRWLMLVVYSFVTIMLVSGFKSFIGVADNLGTFKLM